MAIHTDNMNNVKAPSELVAENWYHVRVAKVEEDTNEKGNPILKIQMKVQDEGPMLGQYIFDRISLQSHALFNLKAYYKAINYNPGPEGHDPEKLLDGEFYIYVEHTKGKDGNTYANVPGWSIRSIQEGRGKKTPPVSQTVPVA